MRNVSKHPYVAVEDLRVGMFIHLEGGWLAHPFPLSNFKLSSPQQIEVIRALGLTSVRWSPDRSGTEQRPPDVAPAQAQRAASDVPTAAVADTQAATGMAPGSPESPESPPALPSPGSQSPAAKPRLRRALAEQRAALYQCQRQFAEATQACKALTELVPTKPQVAREQAESLSRDLVEKVLGHGESCIQLLSEIGSGDKASTHAINVAVISLLLGKALGLGEEDMLDLGVGAMLHDIGKIDVPERLRHRSDHFSASEALVYQEHVAHGTKQGRRMGLREGALNVIGQHHEHADGTGFPRRLGNDRISAASRITALVNRYDNLCNPNMPSRALTPHESLSLMFAQGKSKFDATILGGFIKMMGIYPPGSAVQLNDERYAIVVAVNGSRPLMPQVLVHDPADAAGKAFVLDLQATPQVSIRRSVKPLALPRDALECLSPRPRMAYFFRPSPQSQPQAEPMA